MDTPEMRDWTEMKVMYARLLKKRTGEDVATWNERIKRQSFSDEPSLRAWLTEQGVTGYPQAFLVMERFGYPAFFQASAAELVEKQYRDRPALRPILDAIIAAASGLGEVVVQARQTYVSLVSARRTFARIQPATRTRVDLALRLADQPPGGRLVRSKIHESMPLHISLTSIEGVDDEVRFWLKTAYDENR